MRNLLFGAIILALAVSVAGCDLYGTVKTVKIQYSVPDYVSGTLVKKSVSNVATDTNNVLLSIDNTTGPDNHYTVSTPAPAYQISSDSGGIWLNSIAGNVADPIEGITASSLANADKKFAANASCSGWVRVSGTGTYDPATGLFPGGGQFIMIAPGSMNITGAGKWDAATTTYKGVAKVTIIPANALLYTASNDGTYGTGVPVQATISISGVALTF